MLGVTDVVVLKSKCAFFFGFMVFLYIMLWWLGGISCYICLCTTF